MLYESRAICRYLAAKAGSPLYPLSDHGAHARFEQAASIEQSNFHSAAWSLVYEKLFKEWVSIPNPPLCCPNRTEMVMDVCLDV